MATIHDVENFLRDFKTKAQIFGIFFRDSRQKNTQALLDMELTPLKRCQIVEAVVAIDYSEGPVDDDLNGIASMWIFGRTHKKQEVYIKISMGPKDDPAICISFHLAEYPMSYPLKREL
ncbi:hypothetical protein [Pedobacter antarcticus]|uniref:Toxin n=2 Tax=Pedobacter antarcticus TaxID=34086 RepID=A0A081PE85_9SPHI|nr:hypothetical protein [Pedobacter antarcticus]KEQ29008.1 toxin [Pedobacter antarcticus 4BY]SDL51859.1 hypothetical protein SAMN04488084_101555 [Pedobacter antarcticus]SFE30078.1 hypothetical protein SAMN03003324_00012 [Pedobacter antarcticus]